VIDQLMLAQTTCEQLRIVDEFFLAWKESGQLYFAAANDSLQPTPRRRLAA